jgi:hypothetical protein
MGLADAAVRGIVDSLAFRGSTAPYLLLDTSLRIRAANRAYERATLHEGSQMTGEFMFDVFPDNPATPEVRATERLGTSFEHAMSTGRPDRMPLQRYDVCDPTTGAFVEKSWLPVNTPVRDADGRTVAVLHHVEDVSHLLMATALERHLHAPRALERPRPLAGTPAFLEAVRRDAAARRSRSQTLNEQARNAIERMSRRIGRGDPT